jgi:hypothetical protein
MVEAQVGYLLLAIDPTPRQILNVTARRGRGAVAAPVVRGLLDGPRSRLAREGPPEVGREVTPGLATPRWRRRVAGKRRGRRYARHVGSGPPAVAAVRRGTRRCPRARRCRNRGHHRKGVVGARRTRRAGAWSEGELPRHRSGAPTGRRSGDTGVCRCDIAQPRPCPSARPRERNPENGSSGRGERSQTSTTDLNVPVSLPLEIALTGMERGIRSVVEV